MTIEFGPIRSIQDDLVLSPSLPRLAVRYGPLFVYLGDLQYIRRETFHIEEFILINPNGEGHVAQLLLVHFGGYLENKAGVYQYPDAPSVVLNGDEYNVDTFTLNIQEYISQNKDAVISRAADYIRQRSYTLVGDLAFVRFRRLITEDGRNEFAVLYAEEINDQPVNNEELIARAQSMFEVIK